MARINLNYNMEEELKNSEFKIIPVGPARLALTAGELKTPKDHDKSDYMNWTLEVIGHSDEQYLGQKVWHLTSLGSKSAVWMNRFLEYFDIKMVDGAFDPQDGFGKEIDVILAIEAIPGGGEKNVIEQFIK